MTPRQVSDAEFMTAFKRLAEEQENSCGVLIPSDIQKVIAEQTKVLLYEFTPDYLVVKIKNKPVMVFPKMHGKKCECFKKESRM